MRGLLSRDGYHDGLARVYPTGDGNRDAISSSKLIASQFAQTDRVPVRPRFAPNYSRPRFSPRFTPPRQRSYRIIASTKFVRVWAGSAAATGQRGTRSSKWPSNPTIDPQCIYRGIAKARIEISKDLRYGCYLLPRTNAAVTRMKQLKCGKLHQVIFRKEHGE
jgi:hypothetical protein